MKNNNQKKMNLVSLRDFSGSCHGGDEIPSGTFHEGDDISLGGLGILALCAYLLFKSNSASSPVTTQEENRSRSAQLNGIQPTKRSYRTSDGSADYGFNFEKQSDGTWRAYIENQPSYRGRDTGAHSTHRLTDGARKYVCWTSPLRSLEEAKQVAGLWADKTQQYIRTGNSF